MLRVFVIRFARMPEIALAVRAAVLAGKPDFVIVMVLRTVEAIITEAITVIRTVVIKTVRTTVLAI